MSGKKRLIIIGVLGLVSFAACFALSLMTGDKPTGDGQQGRRGGQSMMGGDSVAAAAIGKLQSLSPKERELDALIKEMRREIQAYEGKKRELRLMERRISLAQEGLRQQAKELEDLRIDVAASLTPLKDARAKLVRERVRITREEAENLRKVAAVYENMQADACAETLAEMVKSGRETVAVGILREMSDRSTAKVLSQFSDKKMAADLSEMMKRVREE
jgi:flagellar motility protein MotE (MotC chaperone)